MIINTEDLQYGLIAVPEMPPFIMIDGRKLAVVNCHYIYKTADDKQLGTQILAVRGFFEGDFTEYIFQFDYCTGKYIKVNVDETPICNELKKAFDIYNEGDIANGN